MGKAAERFTSEKKRQPEDLKELVTSGYLTSIPRSRYGREYDYKVHKEEGRRFFVITCPDTKGLYKGRGLLPPKACGTIRYVEGHGIMFD